MKKIFHSLVLFALVLSLSACFEIKEEVDINKDGSGSYALLIDMSQSKSMIEMAKTLQEDKDKQLFSDLDSSFIRGSQRYNDMKGSSNAKSINNQKDYIFGMKFSFENIAALNNALNEVNKERSPSLSSFPDVYKYSKGILERTDNFFINSIAEMGDDVPDAEQVAAMMREANYVIVVRTDGKIKSVSNKNGVIAADKKSVTLKTNIAALTEDNSLLSSIIKFK